jgi:hypothetical protein
MTLDILYIGATVAIFVAAVAYVALGMGDVA